MNMLMKIGSGITVSRPMDSHPDERLATVRGVFFLVWAIVQAALGLSNQRQ